MDDFIELRMDDFIELRMDDFIELPNATDYFRDYSERSATAAKLREVADILDPPTPKRITLVIEEGRNGVLYFHGATIEPLAEDAE